MATATSKRKPKAATNVLNVAFVWDMSGSMGIVEDATKAGTAAYLLDLQKEEAKLVKKAKGEGVFTRLSLTVFDTEFEPWVVNEPIAEVNVDALVQRYGHRGGTALYDAVAKTITDTESRMRKEKREDEKVLVIVMTDGGENSSQEYSLHTGGRQRIFELIQSYEAKGNWTFIYLGANVDAYAEAGAMGIAPGNTASYASTDSSIRAASASLGDVTMTRRAAATGMSVNSFADAGQPVDYRDQDLDVSQFPAAPNKPRKRSSHEQPFASSKSASDATKKAR